MDNKIELILSLAFYLTLLDSSGKFRKLKQEYIKLWKYILTEREFRLKHER